MDDDLPDLFNVVKIHSNYNNVNLKEMKKIPSFTIDHILLKRGIYVSRKDVVGNDIVTTFDVRMKEPNREPALGPSEIHTIEHLAATFLRNHPLWADKIIYWGPMGCLTGNYLIVKGDLASEDILPLMKETFAFIADFEGDVPGASAKDCGNYLLMNLLMARWEAKKYLEEVLECATNENLIYPSI
jgi:S-ribosylhomocysteine lyase